MTATLTDATRATDKSLPQRLVSALLTSMDAGTGDQRDGHGHTASLVERPNAAGDCFDLLIRWRSRQQAQSRLITVAENLRAGAYGSPGLGLGPDGHLVVVWEDSVQLNVMARCFDPQGQATGPAFVLNTSRDATCRLNPRVKVNASGAFVAVWEHGWTQTRARIFASAGQSAGDELPLGAAALRRGA